MDEQNSAAARIRADLAEVDEEVLLADGFDDALIGIAEGWFDRGRHVVAAYDIGRCIEILMRAGLDEEEAVEYFEYNVTGAYCGPGTPVFLTVYLSEENKQGGD